MNHTASFYGCECGGMLTISTEIEYGRTVERCAGCGYHGPPRARVDIGLVVKTSFEARPDILYHSTTPCVEGCGRMTYGPKTSRCRICATDRHRGQCQRAADRFHTRAKHERTAPVELAGVEMLELPDLAGVG